MSGTSVMCTLVLSLYIAFTTLSVTMSAIANSPSQTRFNFRPRYKATLPIIAKIAPKTHVSSDTDCALNCVIADRCVSFNFDANDPKQCQLLSAQDLSPIKTGNLSDVYGLAAGKSSDFTFKGIYMFGGEDDWFEVPSMFMYFNPDLNVLTVHAIDDGDGDDDGTYMTAVAIDNTRFIIASINDFFWSGYRIYSTISNSIVDYMTHVPYIVKYQSSAMAGDVYVNCGYNDTGGGSDCVLYNTNTGQYSTMDIQEQKYRGCMVAVDNTTVIWMAGKTDSVLSIDVTTEQYQNVSQLPQNREYPACALYGNNSVVMCGGKSPGLYHTSCLSLSLDTLQWTTLPPMIEPRQEFGLANWAGQLYAMGGYHHNGSGHVLPSIEYFDGSSWRASSMKIPTTEGLGQGLRGFGTAVISP